MLPRFIRSILLVCISLTVAISGQDGSEDSKYIRPHDDVGFFLPFKNFPSIEKEGNTEEYKYQPRESTEGMKEHSPNAYENPKHENAPPYKYENQEKVNYMPQETAKEEYKAPAQKEEYIVPEPPRVEYPASAQQNEYKGPEPQNKENYQAEEKRNKETSSPRYPTNFKYQQVSQGDVEEITKEDKIIHERIENIDETLKTIDKMMKDIPSVKRDGPEVKTIDADSEEKLLKKFKDNQKLLPRFPTKPEDTRRMFEHPLEIDIKRISELSLEIQFRKKHGFSTKALEESCKKPEASCKDTKYRSYDGSCNNLQRPSFGSVNTPYRRFLPASYGGEPGDNLPRGVQSHSEETGHESSLPSPRSISAAMEANPPSEATESARNSHMVMQWGQLVDHDILATAGEFFDCCQNDIKKLCRCFPIDIGKDDPFFGQFGKQCLDFTRSSTHCSGDQSDQVNTVTAFLDGSVIYGASEAMAMRLRGGAKRRGGRLVGNTHLPHFLPSKFDLNIKSRPSDKSTDFVAGDGRAETQSSLLSLQNLFFNEHNKIADALHGVIKTKVSDPGALDELVYQEARRLVTAQLQHITFSEWLPAILGPGAVTELGLDHEDCAYKEQVDSGILNSFAAAAFRFGHSMIQSVFRGTNQPWRLGKFYSDARFAFKDGGHGYVNELEGLSEQACQKADLRVSEQLTQRLYCNNKTGEGGGHDLVSLNIQRGRDHGIPGYSAVREKCGLGKLESFDVKPSDITDESWAFLRSVYSRVEDIDLFVGGLAETPAQEAAVGPTFSCIIGIQFTLLMDGDRYFYRHTSGPNIQPIDSHCLKEVKQRRLSDLICEHTDIKELAENVFHQPSESNKKVACSSHRKMDMKSIAKHLFSELR